MKSTVMLFLVAGSTLGAMIIHSMAKASLGNLAWGLDVQQAIDLPNFGPIDGPLLLEQGRFPTATLQVLRELGHKVAEAELPTGLQLIEVQPGRLLGGADPRKEGIAAGD